MISQGFKCVISYINPVEFNRAAGYVIKPRDKVYKRTFSAPGIPDQRYCFVLVNTQIDVFQNRQSRFIFETNVIKINIII